MAINILIVDDSPVMRKVIEKTVELYRYDDTQVFEADNGVEGLKILDEQNIDLLLVDINMPIMDGEQMLKEVQNKSEQKNLPILIISAESNEERIDELDKYSAVFIHKPFTPEKLIQKLDKHIDDDPSKTSSG